MENLITIKNCRIENSRETVIPKVDWQMKSGEAWLVIGPNGGGKADFINALAGILKIKPNESTTLSGSTLSAMENLSSITLTTSTTPDIISSSSMASSSEAASSQAFFSSVFGDSVELVSLERAAHLIQEERENDESEYLEGGVDIGRTGRVFIAEVLSDSKSDDKIKACDSKSDFDKTYSSNNFSSKDFTSTNNFDKAYNTNSGIKKNLSQLPENIQHLAEKLESFPEIKLCGIEKILDRGLKYMSTGEIRRTLLARALISHKKLLLLSDPFAGLDVESRKILLDFFNVIVKNQLKENPGSQYPNVILVMERWHEIPEAITNVLEFTNKKVSFCGNRADYEKLLLTRKTQNAESDNAKKQKLAEAYNSILAESTAIKNTPANSKPLYTNQNNSTNNSVEPTETSTSSESKSESEKSVSIFKQSNSDSKSNPDSPKQILVEMNHVNVGWGDNQVLVDLNWKLYKGEHWLIQGPNGCGKTTFLELITGDNMQVYCNDVHIFGIKRGSGESVWDIKKRLGIVSYRLHVEYRMLGGISLLNVIISGFHDSIGLYTQPSDLEIAAAKKWLALGGFAGREDENFKNLSYGEQRAILILRAAVKAPEILILDEPCHGLDEQYRSKILHLMTLIAQSGTTTMLHVTHDQTEALDCEKHILKFKPKANPMYECVETPISPQ